MVNGSDRIGQDRRSASGGTRAAALMMVALLGGPLVAGSSADASEWDVTADAGVLVANTYAGSDEYYVAPVPAFRASRTNGAYTWYVSLPLEGVGISRTSRSTGLTGTLAASFGGEREREEYSVLGVPVRHDDETRELLAGTPNVSTPLVLEARLQYPASFGVLGISLGYHPTSIARDRAGIADENRHGFLLAMQYALPVRITDALSITGIGGLEFMDANYADSWFAVDRGTEQLGPFAAGAGPRDVQAALHANYAISSRISMSFYFNGMFLLGDAADSPYTVDSYQQTLLLQTSCSF